MKKTRNEMIQALCDHYNAQNIGMGKMETPENYKDLSLESIENIFKALPKDIKSTNDIPHRRLG